MIETTYEDGVAMVTMRHGKVNALDTMLCQALCGEVDHAVADGAQAVVLTGTRDGLFRRGGPAPGDRRAGRVPGHLWQASPSRPQRWNCMVARSGAARRARAQVRRAGSGGCVRVSSPPSG